MPAVFLSAADFPLRRAWAGQARHEDDEQRRYKQGYANGYKNMGPAVGPNGAAVDNHREQRDIEKVHDLVEQAPSLVADVIGQRTTARKRFARPTQGSANSPNDSRGEPTKNAQWARCWTSGSTKARASGRVTVRVGRTGSAWNRSPMKAVTRRHSRRSR